MSHNKGAEAPGVSHVGRTRSAFTIPCVPYDEAYTPRFWAAPSSLSLKSRLASSGPRLRCPNFP